MLSWPPMKFGPVNLWVMPPYTSQRMHKAMVQQKKQSLVKTQHHVAAKIRSIVKYR